MTDIEDPFQRLSFRRSMERFAMTSLICALALNSKDMADLAGKVPSRFFWMRFSRVEWSRP
jgi:hypothetical protein